MSMNCKKAEEYLVEYLYQELPAKKTLEIEKHLRDCASCAKTLESWRAIHRGYQRSAEEPQVAPYFKQKILASAEDELLRKPSLSDRLLFGLKIATVPLAIFVVLIVFNETKNKAPEMAMRNEGAEQHAPAAVSETGARQNEGITAPQAKQQLQDYRDRTESYANNKLKAAPEDEKKRAKDFEETSKKVADKLERSDMDQPVASPPAASEPAPQQEEQSYGAAKPDQREIAQAPAEQKGASISPVSKTKIADSQWTLAQTNLENNNVKEAKNNYEQAISQDSYKALAGELHQNGIMYQNKGEYAKAILQYNLVQSNYRDYPQMDDLLLRLGDSYAAVGQFDNAVKAYRQVSVGQQKTAQQRIQQLQKKREAQQQLKSLGYVDSNKN
jgi:tetratricopeptide (TPR) repeat protein